MAGWACLTDSARPRETCSWAAIVATLAAAASAAPARRCGRDERPGGLCPGVHPTPGNAATSNAGFATVKAVLSGDTVVLQGKGAGGVPAPEMQLSLSSLAAPRVSRHPDQKDEVRRPWRSRWAPARDSLRSRALPPSVVAARQPSRLPARPPPLQPFGWASRDFLRRALIGRAVRFKVDYRVDKIARTFGTLWLAGDGAEASESVNLKVSRARCASRAPHRPLRRVASATLSPLAASRWRRSRPRAGRACRPATTRSRGRAR